MKPKMIGIIGGAGPFAGVKLLEQIFRFCQTNYGCSKNADFPQVLLLSFPFTEMLSVEIDPAQVKRELKDCLDTLKKNGAEVCAIACNTLHAFLDEENEGLILLPDILAAEIKGASPLVLCTSTSTRYGLHKQSFSCLYPNPSDQARVDAIIDEILKGEDETFIVPKLTDLIEEQKENTIVLGCTELSLFASQLKVPGKTMIDPVEIAAQKIVDESFSARRGS
jgi:aspartate racemase